MKNHIFWRASGIAWQQSQALEGSSLRPVCAQLTFQRCWKEQWNTLLLYMYTPRTIDIGRPSRAFPVTPPGIRVRTTAVRLVKRFTIRPIEQDLMS
jgi:hypothetical protein